VIEVHLAGDGPDLGALSGRLEAAAAGTLMESHGVWVSRLSSLARSLQACAWAALLVVAAVAAAVIAVATRAGLSARREAIEIVHGLGATDGYIARRFARRATRLAAVGGALGAVAALPVLLLLARLAAPFAAMDAAPAWDTDSGVAIITALPATLWLVLPGLPVAASLIGFVTAQGTVRRWLRQLP
jgi:cell division transport system permease protein